MKPIELLKRTLLLDEAVCAPVELEGALKVAVVYQDGVTHDWGMQFCSRATRVAGEQSVQSAWYDASSLSEPESLLDAVRATIAADVIVVSVHAAYELPLDLYVWVDAWLPHRCSRTGALTALIGATEPLNAQIRTAEYLQAVARMAQLDFVQEHKHLIVSPSPSCKPLAEPARTKAQTRAELYGRGSNAFTIGL